MEKKYLLYSKYPHITIFKLGTKRTYFMAISIVNKSKDYRSTSAHFYFSLFNNKLKFKIEATK